MTQTNENKIKQIKERSEQARDWVNECGLDAIHDVAEKARLRLDLSIEDFSELLGFESKYAYGYFLRDAKLDMRASQLVAFCRIFGCDIDDFANQPQIQAKQDALCQEVSAWMSNLSPETHRKIAHLINISDDENGERRKCAVSAMRAFADALSDMEVCK